MKKKLIVSVSLLATLILFGCQQSKVKEVKQYTIEQFMDTISIRGSSFSFDEKNILFSSNKTGIYNAYTIPVEGGETTQLTDSTEDSIFALSYFPNDSRILYSSDKGGNEINHIYLRNMDGTIEDLTAGEKAKAMFGGWSYDEKSFFYVSNKRNPKFFDFYEMDIKTFESTMMHQNNEGYISGAISNDKRYMAFGKVITGHNSDIYLLDRKTEELKHLSPHEGDVNYIPAAFSADSKNLYYLTDEGSEFQYLKRYDIETGESETVEAANWDVMYAGISRNGKYRVIGINNDAKTKIKIFDNETGEYVELPELPEGEITSVNISKSEKLMSFYVNGSKSPNNLYFYDFNSKSCEKLTDSMNPEINLEDLVDEEVVRYKSFDDLEIPSIYYKPHNIKPGEKLPALVWVHGGPGGQTRIGYSAFLQYLVNHGYVVIGVNNRGSSGYGKTFFKLDDLKHGSEDLDDCVEAKKFLISTGYVDENKIGIIGGSYGGYMVVAALAFRPEAFTVGVDIFGVTNWVRTLKSIPPWWEAQREALYKELGNPFENEEFLRKKSPLFHAKNIIRPLIVLQGANDPRVLQVESDEMVEAVRKNDVPVEYIVFPDEGHGFVKKENEIKGFNAILKFLDTYLKGSSE